MSPEDGHSANDGNGHRPNDSAAVYLRALSARLAELRGYAGYFLAAKLDRLKLTIRQVVLLTALGIIGLIAVAAAIVTAVVLTLRGIAGALAETCGHIPWLGDLLCGILVLSVLVIGLWVSVKRFTKMSRESTVQKYESDQRKHGFNPGSGVSQPGGTPVGGAAH
jgi:integral membrane sensor domain MASE1